MSRHIEDVIVELLSRIGSALPAARVVRDEEWPRKAPADGWVNLHEGEMDSPPDVDLSPLRYNWVWPIDVELVVCPPNPADRHAALDALITGVSAAIEADRQLGGLVEFLEVEPGATEDIQVESGDLGRGGRLTVLAQFSTTSPTG